jgi:hypothetical protein
MFNEFVVLALTFHNSSSRVFPSKLPQLLSFLLIDCNWLAATLITLFNQPFNQVWHLATFPCINTSACLKINQHRTGLKCVSYSVTQVKSQLHKKSLNICIRSKSLQEKITVVFNEIK